MVGPVGVVLLFEIEFQLTDLRSRGYLGLADGARGRMQWVRVFTRAVTDETATHILDLLAQRVCTLPGVGLDSHPVA